ncbi:MULTISPECIES: protein kinase [unclassified Cryobacterium]|uniref:protein kinase domain-containing protein n=1 Tax=unclassified Cryobacterium TaxID=2649013 RepID=UPI00106DC5DA|nr:MULTISPECIES: protein kinase [unclassified Cryobacterium]TFC51110.1 GAF domain-containing protein [Cryobacterium sp. TMB3-1-2]TFC74456.1 GAF domain-containing protein [Cryobacterium sp. TMB3-15]TFC79969.1 GAF domain-containing protein [Cryobacterium sp. TMB3-10]TFD41870.1 GAF domain-containing protein [Cryobacterium sp. TMB3-12]
MDAITLAGRSPEVTAAGPPRLRGRYRLLELIGRGGEGSVYRARDETLGRDVAVKVFEASATTEKDIRRQEDEVNLLASLSHHSLVTLLDAGVDRTDVGRPRVFFVMELVTGADLKVQLERGTLSARQIAHIGYDLAEGLQYIHHRGVVHRDVKPANVLLVDYNHGGARYRAKLTDFGIALVGAIDRRDPDAVTTGTAAYLSPEQTRGQTLGSASDVYSLGLVLLECFTRTIAFPGDPIPSALARLRKDPSIPPGIAPEWRALLAAMTARDPKDRPSIHDLVVALRQMVAAETGRHRDVAAISAPSTEEARMLAVARYRLPEAPADGSFDRVTAIAARVFSVPVALVTIVDQDRIWFTSHHGLEIDHIERHPGLCASAILDDVPWVVEDARFDPRTLANPLVASDFGLQFYAGVPLRTRDGHNLGTLCVLDFEPRQASEEELATLGDLAAVVMSEMELRLEGRRSALALKSATSTPS